MSTTIIEQAIAPFAETMTRESALKIVELKANADLQSRVDDLADKANSGQLTDSERTEYDQFLAAFHLITVLQVRARRLLNG